MAGTAIGGTSPARGILLSWKAQMESTQQIHSKARREMSLYTVMLFLHVAGDIGIFVGIGFWLLGAAGLRQAESVAQVRLLAGLMVAYEPVSTLSALLTLASGLYMAAAAWGLQAGWTGVALASLIVILPPLLLGILQPRMHLILKLARESADGPVPGALAGRIHDPRLGMALQLVAALMFGIVFLMTIKPGLAGSVIAMATALTLGLASSLPLWWAARPESKINR
jgi:hypothetical protein